MSLTGDIRTLLRDLVFSSQTHELRDLSWRCPDCGDEHISELNLTRLRRSAIKEGRLTAELTLPCLQSGRGVCVDVPLFAGERDWEFVVLAKASRRQLS